ncbi:MAG: hypothetical protein ACRCYD_13225, partial [Plesiomonas sp.]
MDNEVDLRRQLAQLEDSYQKLSSKQTRESELLRRVLGRVTQSLEGADSELDRILIDIRIDLERAKETSLMAPRLALLERLAFKLSQQRLAQQQRLNEGIVQSAESLKSTAILSPQLRQDAVLQLNAQYTPDLTLRIERTLHLLSRAVRMLAALGEQHANQPSNTTLALDTQQKVSDELQHLISELDFDAEVGQRLLEIRNHLLIGTDAAQLIQYSFEIIELILQGTRTERRSSHRFLTSLNDDLGILHQSMNKSVEHAYLDHHHMQLLNKEMQSTLNELEQPQALSSEQTQQTVQVLLQQTQQHQQLCQQMHATIERIQSNENVLCTILEQTTDYRNRLLDQQHRLFLDHLTKVYNRAALQERQDLEYKRWQRYRQPLWFV